MVKKKKIDMEIVAVNNTEAVANINHPVLEVANCDLKQQDIEQLIYVIRGTQVMIDSDLAMLYGVETKRLNEAVKRNANRFPDDFMFQLTQEEAIGSRSQIATLKAQRDQNIKYLPYAFTSNGIAMLSSVLRSQIAVSVNIRIMRAFTAAQQFFDAYTFVSDLIRSANKSIVLFDNYVDDTVLTMLDKRNSKVSATIYTRKVRQQLSLDIDKHNAQYQPIDVKQFDRVHDRYLCIDNTVYHIGASLKDLGKRWFSFNKMEMTAKELLENVK